MCEVVLFKGCYDCVLLHVWMDSLDKGCMSRVFDGCIEAQFVENKIKTWKSGFDG